jgi:hypothetical protein
VTPAGDGDLAILDRDARRGRLHQLGGDFPVDLQGLRPPPGGIFGGPAYQTASRAPGLFGYLI